MKRIYKSIFCLLLFLYLPIQEAQSQSVKPYTICIDIGGSDANSKTQSIEKLFSSVKIDIVREAFKRAGKSVTFINDGPWKRCLNDVALGYVDFAMGVFYDEDRARIFDFSDHYNTESPIIFFMASRNLRIEKVEDLMKLQGCGIYGYSYSHYNLPIARLDFTYDYGSLYRKMVGGRCDYFLDELESVADSNNDVNFLSDPLIRHSPAKWATAPTTHIVTKKAGIDVPVLKEFNKGLKILIDTGQAAKIWKGGMDGIPYNP